MTLRRSSVVILLVLAACSGDGGGGGLSKAEFIKEADDLCLSFHDRSSALAEPTSQTEVLTFIDRVIALAAETRTDFAALEAPDDGKAVHTALLASLSDTTQRLRDARDAAARGDQAGFAKGMKDADEVGQRADPEAKAYGFKVCGSEDELPDT